MRRQRSVLFCGPASEGWGYRGRPNGIPHDGVDTTMATPEMMLVWRHVDDVLIAKLAVRVTIPTRILLKCGRDERQGSKPKKYEVSGATKMSFTVW